MTRLFGSATFLLSYAVSILLGVAKALRHNSCFDSLSSMLIYMASVRCPPTWRGSSSITVSLRSIWSGCPWGFRGRV